MQEKETDIQEIIEMDNECIIVYCGCSSKNTTGTSKGGCGGHC